MTTVARKGVGALLIAYLILIVVTLSVVAAVLAGRDKSQAVVSLRLPSAAPTAATAAPASPPTQAPAPAPVPNVAAVALQPAPAVEPPPAPAPAPAPSTPLAPTAAEPAKPTEPPPAAAAEKPQEPAPLTSLYPPPPPEKPQPAARTAEAPAQARAAPTALQENGPYGPLPRIASDGRLPWIAHNGKFDHGTRQPRLGLVLTGLGLNPQVTEDAIIRLPAEITLAFVPQAENLPRWIQLAREFGHEVLIALPMEGDGPADAALGARTLSTQVSVQENLDRLRWLLSRSGGYVGVATWEGEKFLANGSLAVPVLQELALRGLMVVDSRQARSNLIQQQSEALGLPFAKSRGFLDSEQGVAALDRNLQQLEAIAQRSGFAVAMAVAFPDTVKRLTDWSKTVSQRGFVLAPITGVTECKDFCQQRVARHAAAVSTSRR